MIVHYIRNRDDDTGNAVRVTVTVHIFGKADKANTHLYKQVVNQTASVTVISCETGKVFHNHTVYFAAHNIGKEPLEILPVGVCSRVSVIHILGNAFKFVLVLEVKVSQQVTLIFYAVAVVFTLPGFFQIFFGEPDVCAQPPAADSIRGRETLLKSSVFCSCHCSSFPITLHLYYNSARAGQQGCLCIGTLCLEVANRP